MSSARMFQVIENQERLQKINHFKCILDNILNQCQKYGKQPTSRREYTRKLESAIQSINEIMFNTVGIFYKLNERYMSTLDKMAELQEFKERTQAKKKKRRKQYKQNQKLKKEIDFSQEIDEVDHGRV